MRDAATASTKGKMENRYAVCGGAAVARSGLRATARAIAAGQHLVSAPVGLRGGTLRTAQTTPLNMMVRKSPEVCSRRVEGRTPSSSYPSEPLELGSFLGGYPVPSFAGLVFT